MPVDERVAYLDNDGTMWCEKPTYVQFDFFVDALKQRAAADASLRERPEFAAVLDGDMAAIGEIGLTKVAGALAALFDEQTPDEFDAAVDDFLDRYRHPTLGAGLDGVIYQPMLELLDELRARDFTIGIVTGGGTEFVRRVSRRCYGVEPGMVVGTLIGYAFDRDDAGKPMVRRTISAIGSANEGGPRSSTSSPRSGARRCWPSATPAATARCSNGPRPAGTAAWRSSSTTTTTSASSPTRARR